MWREKTIKIIIIISLLPALATARAADLPREWREPNTGITMAWVQGGCYEMGSTAPPIGAKPIHRVCLDGFWMAKTEVTHGQYGVCLAAGACPAPEKQDSGINEHFRTGKEDNYQALGEALTAADHPLIGVSWVDAQRLVTWLNQQGQGSFRLPTEAEWEYACRSGGRTLPVAEPVTMEPLAWFDRNSQGRPHPVAVKPANDLGLHDMQGNVWEWVQDVYHVEAYQHHNAKNPLYIREDLFRVTRGGSWSSPALALDCSYRGVGEERDRDDNLGFRLVRQADR